MITIPCARRARIPGACGRAQSGSSRELGSALETLSFHHLRVLASLMMPPARLYFWPEHGGLEVDLILEDGRQVLGIEVKLSTQVGYGDAAPLRPACQRIDRADRPHALIKPRQYHAPFYPLRTPYLGTGDLRAATPGPHPRASSGPGERLSKGGSAPYPGR